MLQSSSRPPANALLRVALFTAAALGAFGSIVLLAALLVAWWQGTEHLTGAGLLLGLTCGLVVWLFVVIFHIKRETVTMPFDDGAAFLRRMCAQMESMGYTVSAPSASVLIGQPTFGALLFGGGLVVRLGRSQAVLVGPKFYLERLRRGGRVHNHLEQVHQALNVPRPRQGEPLLRQADFKLGLPGELVAEVARELAAALEREGASLQFELHVRARSEAGLRERLVDKQFFDLLRKPRCVVEVRKDPLNAAAAPAPAGCRP